MSESTFKIKSKRYRLSARFQFVIFPFTTGELLNALARVNLGYTLAPPPKTPVPVGTNLDWSGVIAKKNNVLVDIDSVSQMIGVDSQNPVDAVTIFSEILDIIRVSLVPDLDEHQFFYELISNHVVEIDQNPLELMRKHGNSDIIDSVSEILEESFSNYSVHLSSVGNTVNSTTWYDLKIQPTTLQSNKSFDVMTVYRKPTKESIDKFAQNIDQKLHSIFDVLNAN